MKQVSYPLGDRRKSLYGKPETARYGGIEHSDKFGTDITIRSSTPPPVAEYDEYLRGRNVRFCNTNHFAQKTGFRLRRIVVMRKNGSSWKECGEAVGIGAKTAKEWVEFLPLRLAP